MRQISRFAVVFILGFLLVGRLPAEEKDLKAKVSDKSLKILVTTCALEALGKLGDSKALDVLLEALKSKEFFIRAYAAQALGRLNDKKAIPYLLKMIVSDKNYLAKIYATRALVELGQLDTENSLLNFLSDKDPAVRANAVEQLGGFGGEKCLPILVRLLSEDNDFFVRMKAIEQLGKHKFEPAVAYIRKAMEDENGEIRRAACFAIGQFADKKDIPLLIERLGDNGVLVRATAKEVLSQFQERSLAKFFWQDVEDKDALLQASSYVALANIKDINILPVLLKEVVAPENPTTVRVAAVRALMILKPYVSELIDMALSLSKTGAISLENLDISYKANGKNLVTVFIEAMSDENNPLYKDAPFVLKELKEKTALPALLQALYQPDPDTVANVAYVLGELQDKKAVSNLIEVCKRYGF